MTKNLQLEKEIYRQIARTEGVNPETLSDKKNLFDRSSGICEPISIIIKTSDKHNMIKTNVTLTADKGNDNYQYTIGVEMTLIDVMEEDIGDHPVYTNIPREPKIGEKYEILPPHNELEIPRPELVYIYDFIDFFMKKIIKGTKILDPIDPTEKGCPSNPLIRNFREEVGGAVSFGELTKKDLEKIQSHAKKELFKAPSIESIGREKINKDSSLGKFRN